MKIYHLLLIVQIASFAVSCNSQGKDDSLSIEKNPKISGQFVIDEFDKANFFNLTDKDKIDEAKESMISSYEDLQYFGGLTYTDSLVFVDHRFYSIDQEELFELGGLVTYLNNVKSSFNLLGLKLDYENENNNEESQKNNYWKHTIELNGKVYTAFEGQMNGKCWGIAMINFAEMLNDQLKRQNSEEQVYLIYNDNDGMIVFLTQKMYELVLKYYPNDQNRPMTVEQWKKYYKI